MKEVDGSSLLVGLSGCLRLDPETSVGCEEDDDDISLMLLRGINVVLCSKHDHCQPAANAEVSFASNDA